MAIDNDYMTGWTLLNQETDGLNHLAFDQVLIRQLPTHNQNRPQDHPPLKLVHWYPIKQPTILLGAKDTRLKAYDKGKDFLKSQGYQVLVRPHGGLGIVCDPGIVNLSLIIDSDKSMSIDQAYQFFMEVLNHLLEDLPLTLANYEVDRSYCPGKFDIVVKNKKIGGLAQRRFKTGISIAAYLSLRGNQEKRADLMKQFYLLSQADSTYPNIDASSMASLSDLLGQTYTDQDFLQSIHRKLLTGPGLDTLQIESSDFQNQIATVRLHLAQLAGLVDYH